MSSLKRTISPVTHHMLTHSITTLSKLILMVVVIWCDILCGQVRRSLSDIGGQTVPEVSEGRGTVPTRVAAQSDRDDPLGQNPSLDNLDLVLLQIEIAKAEKRVTETSFWSRITPRIHLSASFGMHDIMFVDPATFLPYVLPRDDYRLTISLSLDDVFNSSGHAQAVLELERLRTEESIRTMKQLQSRRSLEQQLNALQAQSALLEKEMSFIQELLHFNELRFQQGKIEFDALTRSKLELSAAMRSLLQLRLQEAMIQSKLSS